MPLAFDFTCISRRHRTRLDKPTYVCYNGYMDSLTYFKGTVRTRSFHIEGAVVVLDDTIFADATIRLSDCVITDDFTRDKEELAACFVSDLNFKKFIEKYEPTSQEQLLIEFAEAIFDNQFFLIIFKQSELSDYKKFMIHEFSHLLYHCDNRYRKLANRMMSSTQYMKESVHNELASCGYTEAEYNDEACAFMMEGEFPPPADELRLYSKLRRIVKSKVRETFPDSFEISGLKNSLVSV